MNGEQLIEAKRMLRRSSSKVKDEIKKLEAGSNAQVGVTWIRSNHIVHSLAGCPQWDFNFDITLIYQNIK